LPRYFYQDINTIWETNLGEILMWNSVIRNKISWLQRRCVAKNIRSWLLDCRFQSHWKQEYMLSFFCSCCPASASTFVRWSEDWSQISKETLSQGNDNWKPNPLGTRLLELLVRIPLRLRMSLSCECYVLSDIGHCCGPITRPEESYRLCCFWLCLKNLTEEVKAH